MTALIADVDGTLCIKAGDIYPLTRKALNLLHEKGVRIGLGTGRAVNQRVFSMAPYWKLDFTFDFIVGMNGGQLWTSDSGTVENIHLLPEETLKEILVRMRPLGLNAVIYEGEQMVSLYMDMYQEESMKRNNTVTIVADGDEDRLAIRPNNNILFRYGPEQEDEVLSFVKGLTSPRYIAMRTAPGCVEFMNPRVNKGDGLLRLSEATGIPVTEILAFGDNDNDALMVKEAGWGVAMKNGSEYTKSLADAISEYACEEDGVGRYLFDHGYIRQNR